MKTTATALLGLVASLTATNATVAQCRIRPAYPVYQQTYVQRVPHTSTFGSRRHLDRLADQLRKQANDITWEMYRSYQHNPEFVETYNEMYKLLGDAQHIHDLIHDAAYRHGHHDVDHIADDLHEFDALFHHIEDDIEHWAPTYNSRHFVHAHGNLHSKMEHMEETLHHLMDDYGVRSNVTTQTPPPAPTTALAPPRL